MDRSKITNSYELFIYKAVVDLNSAKCLLKAFNEDTIEIDIEKIYFELQQSGEKYLKAVLSKKAVDFPKSHDIEQLINISVKNSIILDRDIEMLIELSDYAVEGRYSIIHDDLNDSDKYIVLLERLLEKYL